MIVRICPDCQTENDAGILNCTQCGASLAGQKMIFKAESSETTASAASDSNVEKGSDQKSIENVPIPTEMPSQPPIVLEMAVLERKMKSGASWFFWIAAMTVINSILIRTSTDRTFILGLGATIFVDVFSLNFANENPEISTFFLLLGIFLDALVVGFFIAFGYFSRLGRIWSFIIGMTLYSLDSLIFLVVGDFFALLFHILALFYIFSGLRAARGLKKLKLESPIIDMERMNNPT